MANIAHTQDKSPFPWGTIALAAVGLVGVLGLIAAFSRSAEASPTPCPAFGEPLAGLGYQHRVVGVTARAGTTVEDDGKSPIVVAFHKRGGTPSQMLDALTGLGTRALVIAPQGPQVFDSGRAWFMARSIEPNFESQLAASLDQVLAFVRDVRRCFAADRRLIVTGDAQGAHLALGIAVRDPGLADGVVEVGGVLPESVYAAASQLPSPTVLVHGKSNTSVPFVKAKTMADAWKAKGLPSEWAEVNGDHQLTGFVRSRWIAELRQAVAPTRR